MTMTATMTAAMTSKHTTIIVTALAVIVPFGVIAGLTILLLRRFTDTKLFGDMRTSEQGRALIKEFEGYRSEAYKCTSGVWTIGWGHTAGVAEGDRCTEAEAEAWLTADLRTAEAAVNAEGLDISQNQFDALVSFVFNLGAENFRQSTLLKKIKADPDDATIADEFGRWTYSAGVSLQGLAKRRSAEAALYFG